MLSDLIEETNNAKRNRLTGGGTEEEKRLAAYLWRLNMSRRRIISDLIDDVEKKPADAK